MSESNTNEIKDSIHTCPYKHIPTTSLSYVLLFSWITVCMTTYNLPPHALSIIYLIQIQILYYYTRALLFSTKSRKHRAFTRLIYNFPNIYMVTKTCILCHLFSDIHTTTTQTPPSIIHLWLQKPRVFCFLLSDIHNLWLTCSTASVLQVSSPQDVRRYSHNTAW